MDCSVQPTRVTGVSLITTTDFFYPAVECPYVQGRISCANVLSDMYAVGVADIDNVLMILAASLDMEPPMRDIVTREMVRGFNDLCIQAGTKVRGGQSVLNPWPILGGVAQAVVQSDRVLRPENAVPGDVVVLTKPLGTQVAVNLHQWLSIPESWAKVDTEISPADVVRAYNIAAASMMQLNITGARLMHEFEAHACTDVTGFGILGHASNLAREQKENVDIEIDKLVVIAGMAEIDAYINGGSRFKLLKGYSAETSGGLLVCLPSDKAEAYCEAVYATDGWRPFVVGRVVPGSRKAHIVDNVDVIAV